LPVRGARCAEVLECGGRGGGGAAAAAAAASGLFLFSIIWRSERAAVSSMELDGTLPVTPMVFNSSSSSFGWTCNSFARSYTLIFAIRNTFFSVKSEELKLRVLVTHDSSPITPSARSISRRIAAGTPVFSFNVRSRPRRNRARSMQARSRHK
jgi:hypothetical protein